MEAGAQRSTAPSSCRRWYDLAVGNPLWTVALLSGISAIVSGIVIWRTRDLGAFDPDEAGYLASSLRFHRNLAPLSLIREIAHTSTGPLVPLLSTPLLVLGPRDPRTAMMIQPLLMVAVAVAVTGITRRLASDVTALLAGLFVAATPTVILASQSYWYGLGTAACSAGAVWALLASEQLTNRWRFVFGALVGAMLLTRTMSLGLAPGLVVAGVVQAWGSRRRFVGLGQAILVSLVVAAPWWFAQRTEIWSYLFEYGYGERAGLWGSGGPWERLVFRVERLTEMNAMPTPLLTVAALVGVAVVMARTLKWSPWLDRTTRDWLSCAVVVVLGLVALVSTTNQGVWFELPISVVLVPLVAASLASAPLPVPKVAAFLALAFAICLPISVRARSLGHADAALERHDPRFSTATASVAAEDWWQLTNDVLDQIERAGSSDSYLSGNTFLLNTNTLLLAGELRGRPLSVTVPDTLGSGAERRAVLQQGPMAERSENRLLVIARHDRDLFTPDLEVERLYAEALEAGWEVTWSTAMPGEGSVEVLRHRER